MGVWNRAPRTKASAAAEAGFRVPQPWGSVQAESLGAADTREKGWPELRFHTVFPRVPV